MVIPEGEFENAAVSMIDEYGEKAADETSTRIAESKARGFDFSARAWERVLGCIQRLQDEGMVGRNGVVRQTCSCVDPVRTAEDTTASPMGTSGGLEVRAR